MNKVSNEKAVAIIPARGGSKRIPRKNIKLFHGKPLIAYSIEVALNTGLFEKVVVSTEDDEIAQISKNYGAEVPFMRPKSLADDHTGSGVAVAHALDTLKACGETYEYLCTIYATAPLLQCKYLIEGFEVLKKSTAKNAFGVASMPSPIQRSFKITKEGRCEMFWPENMNKRSQDLEAAYHDAGQFWWTRLSVKSDESMFGKDSIPIILPRYLVQDIDTPEDWEAAELVYASFKK